MRIEDHFAAMARRVTDLEQRFDKVVRHGKVTDVDEKKHQIRMRIGGTDEKPLKSPWIPYGQIAGALKLHSMPSVGQTMTMFCPTGDLRQAIATPLTWSDENKSPSEKKDEHVLTFENVTITLKKDHLTIKVGDATLDVTKDKIILTVGGAEFEVKSGAINSVADKIISAGKTYIGMEAKDDASGMLLDIHDGIPAKKAYSKPG